MNKLYSLFTAIALVFTFELPAHANRSVMEAIWSTDNSVFVSSLTSNVIFGGTVTVNGSSFSVGGSSFTVGGGSSTVAYQMSAGSFSGPLTGNVTGNVTGSSSLNVLKTGDTMTGQLTTTSTITVQGNAFSVGGSAFVVAGGQVAIGTTTAHDSLTVYGGSIGLYNNNWIHGYRQSGGQLFDLLGYAGDVSYFSDPPGNQQLTLYNNNVGIGVVNPTVPLDVLGAIHGTSSVTASAFFGDGSHLTGVGSDYSVQTDVTASRASSTIYHNTTGHSMVVTISWTGSGSGTFYSGGSNPPTTAIGQFSNSSAAVDEYVFSFTILNGNYYETTSGFSKWIETH